MKKITLFIISLFLVFVLIGCGAKKTNGTTNNITTKSIVTTNVTTKSVVTTQAIDEEKDTTTLQVHYYRFDEKYDSFEMWIWKYEPVPGEGSTYYFDKLPDGNIKTDNWGAVATINLTNASLTNSNKLSTKVGIIIKEGSGWDKKDVAMDRYIAVPAKSMNGVIHAYFVQGDERIGLTADDSNGPSKANKFNASYFKNESSIYFQTTCPVTASDITLTANGEPVNIETVLGDKVSGSVNLKEDVDLTKTYVIHSKFKDEEFSYTVTFDGIYDSKLFNDTFEYTGDDLGVTFTASKTVFKLWAPVSSKVTLNLYQNGTPASLGGTDVPYKTVDLEKGEKGVWSCEVEGNLHSVYYTYTVTNGSSTNEVVDPYARSAGINGNRGQIVDFSQINPSGFVYGERATFSNPTDAIIYEFHVRDLTTHESWNGTESNRGKFLGLIEEGTTYTGNGRTVKTGFDHIKELGITHIQLIPIYDHAATDETKDEFNWGYMPLNYNCLEGSYSSNAYDGLARITEFKQVVMAYNKAGIRINMDVVYNHTGLTADSNFSLIVPGYYYRMKGGTYSNGSGCGNEVASERSMVRKFMVDSVLFWATEYNLGGFRFDLMGLHDIETMNIIAEKLHEIDPNILVYGEPWTGGTAALASSKLANQGNILKLENVGAFNDNFRDGVKGVTFGGNVKAGGFVQNNTSNAVSFANRVKYGIVGGIEYTGINYQYMTGLKAWHGEPYKTINYVSCHDNNTLHDKIIQSISSSQDLEDVIKQATSLVFVSQGISFMQGGDEFMRAKLNKDGTYNDNSYDQPDEVNNFKWNTLVNDDNYEVYEYYKGLIAMRKAYSGFRMPNKEAILANLVLYDGTNNLIMFKITNPDSSDTSWHELFIATNNSDAVEIDIPEGTWSYLCNISKASATPFDEFTGNKVTVSTNETIVLVR